MVLADNTILPNLPKRVTYVEELTVAERARLQKIRNSVLNNITNDSSINPWEKDDIRRASFSQLDIDAKNRKLYLEIPPNISVTIKGKNKITIATQTLDEEESVNPRCCTIS